jgi:hypothetical protein
LKASSPKNPGEAKGKAKKSDSKLSPSKKSPKGAKEMKETIEDKPKEIVFRKPEFIDKLSQKTGMTKSQSESALSSVLEIITEVSY